MKKEREQIERVYALLSEDEITRFKKALRKHKKVQCVSSIDLFEKGLESCPSVRGYPEDLSDFEFSWN